MLKDRVRVAVPSPGTVNVGSSITLGAAPVGFVSFLAAFGGGKSAYFVLSDGAGRTLTGVGLVNASVPETLTVQEILGNDRLGGVAGETFSGACSCWNTLPAGETVVPRLMALGGNRNLLINANPMVNQRLVASGAVSTVANQYMLDRWRVAVAGQAMSWSDGSGIRTVTAPAGGVEQPIEDRMFIGGGVYTLSWIGTAAATINGVNVVKGGQIVLPANTIAVLRFSGGTFSLPQLESGTFATAFEQQNPAIVMQMCMRFFQRFFVLVSTQAAESMNFATPFMAPMRAIPTNTTALVSEAFVSAYTLTSISTESYQIGASFTSSGFSGRNLIFIAEL